MGLDVKWLIRHLRDQGIQDVRSVYLALCDTEHNLSCYLADA